MQNLETTQLNQVSGGLSSAEVATAAGLAGKTLVEGLVAGYQDGNVDPTATAISTAATFAGVYAGFYAYHLLCD